MQVGYLARMAEGHETFEKTSSGEQLLVWRGSRVPEFHLEGLESDEHTIDIYAKPLAPAKSAKHRSGLDIR